MRITWKPTKKQFEAWRFLDNKTHTEILFGGGAGGGKSFLGCAWLIINCLRYKGSRWLMGRAILKSLKQTTLLTLFDVLKEWGFQVEKDYKYNSNEGLVMFSNGSVIYLKDLLRYPSDPNFDSLGSTEYTGAFVDEASQVSDTALEVINARLRYKTQEFGIKGKILIATNPCKGYLYREFYKARLEGKIKPHKAFIPALATDNPYIPEDYMDKLKNLSRTLKERLYFGNWEYDDDPAKLIEYDSIIDLFSNNFVKGGKKYISVDVAFRGSELFVLGYWNGLRLEKIHYLQKSEAKQIEGLIKKYAEEYGVPRSHIVYDHDGIGGFLGSYLNGAKSFLNGSKPIGKEKFNNLKTQCYYKLAEYINSGKIYINEKREEVKNKIIEELEVVKEDKLDNDEKIYLIKKDKVKELIGRSPDFSDMMMMRMYFELNRAVNIGVSKFSSF